MDRRKWAYVGMAVLLLVGVLLFWKGAELQAKARVGAAYGAHVACSCRYVEGRGMESCNGDREPGMGILSITDLPSQRAVRVSVPVVATRTARFRPGFGCLLDPS